MTWRVAVGGIWHETNTFAVGMTDLAAFRRYQFAVGEEILARYERTGTEVGGMLEGAQACDFALVPTVFAAAVPSGVIDATTFDRLCDGLVSRLEAARPVDGVLLALHGAMVAEGCEDADAHVLVRARAVVGPRCPIVATFDYHANLSEAMVRAGDVLIGYDTYPHVDMRERGQEAAAVLAGLLAGRARPVGVLTKLPLITVPQVQATDRPPMRDILAELHRVESASGVLCGSVAMGFAYADVTHLGASVLVYADDRGTAERLSARLGHAVWTRREDFRPELVPVGRAVKEALESDERPVVLVDAADNVGGGSPGDGTVVLDALLRARAPCAVVVLCDPEAVAHAWSTGVGNEFHAQVGGKTDALHGPSVAVKGQVRLLEDATYRHTGTYMTGQEVSMGHTAVVACEGILVVLTENRTMPFDAEQLRVLGIDPEQQDIIAVKSAVAWRAAYGTVCRRSIVVDGPGICASDLTRLPYRRRPRPLFPLEPDATFTARAERVAGRVPSLPARRCAP